MKCVCVYMYADMCMKVKRVAKKKATVMCGVCVTHRKTINDAMLILMRFVVISSPLMFLFSIFPLLLQAGSLPMRINWMHLHGYSAIEHVSHVSN